MMPQPTYADLAGLVDETELVVRAEIRDQIRLAPERAPDVAPGMARLYIEARTGALLSGSVPVGETLRYLVDVPLRSDGKVPKLKKQQVLLFARPVPGRTDELQLVERDAQLAWTPELESRLRPILADFIAPDAPPVITGVSEGMSIEGNLAGETETQFFLSTERGEPVSLTILRRPSAQPQWGVSWSELVVQSDSAPAPRTVGWYRLACSLPRTLPQGIMLTDDAAARLRAERDYAFVLEQLGSCERNRT
ncbi:hypothetical protein [Qipengyuania sp. JC766]|uniref:hypothetical protein n=1 Tax=Qipengyuania sp. JC766 TaxID=3232139 RepID=UPI00345B146C